MNKQDWLDLLQNIGKDGELFVSAIIANLPAIEQLISEIVKIVQESKATKG